MSHANDAAPATDAFIASDATLIPDAHAADAASPSTPDAARLSYERDVRPVLEASRCGSCHGESAGVVMSYAWISTPGTTWCQGERYERRWSCFEEHARTQTGDTSGQSCGSAFYHRHGEPCFTATEQATVLAWAAGGYAE